MQINFNDLSWITIVRKLKIFCRKVIIKIKRIMMVIERKNLKKLEEKFKDDPNGIDL